MDYKAAYLLMFNKVTDALAHIEAHQYADAISTLEDAQKACEEMYMELDEDN